MFYYILAFVKDSVDLMVVLYLPFGKGWKRMS